VSAYRDNFDHCPRCKSDLVDAGAGRACVQCRGQWINGPTLQEMMVAMQPTPAPVPLQLDPHAHDVIGCPECGKPMETLTLHGVEIDRCQQWHGIWFDSGELQLVLLRSVS
jgi:Zn-finger nucleic acid-binding protein